MPAARYALLADSIRAPDGKIAMDTSDRQKLGRETIVKLFGEEYLKNRDANTNAFNQDYMRFSNEVAFGTIWCRAFDETEKQKLNPKIRSLVNLAMFVAFNKMDRIRFHVVTALNFGATIDEIKEVLLQATVYCGLPAGQDAFEAAEAALRAAGALDSEGETEWKNGHAEWRISPPLQNGANGSKPRG